MADSPPSVSPRTDYLRQKTRSLENKVQDQLSGMKTLPSTISKKDGSLEATILSAYDLPFRDPPLKVQLRVNDRTVQSGPPAQRHKDRNSFKFNAPNNQVCLSAPLAELYASNVQVTVVYADQENNLVADYSLDKLQIQTSTWLILTLDSASSTTDPDAVSPTLRIQLTLAGPYRTEVAAMVAVGKSWFRAIDQVESALVSVTDKIPLNALTRVDPRWFVIPAVPLLATLVVCAPAIAGVLVVGLPMILPVVVAAGGILLVVAAALGVLYGSTSTGRKQIGGLLSPIHSTLLASKSGQRAIYQTGDRPTPVGLAKAILPITIWQKLIVSLLIDLIGSSSYLIPGVGEVADVGWAPFQTILIMAMYDNTSPSLKYISFVEEILPFTDVIPSATAGWLMEFGPPLIARSGVSESAQEQVMDLLSTKRREPAAATATPSLTPAR